MIKILQTNQFQKAYKRFTLKEQSLIKVQIRNIQESPTIGVSKKGKLKEIRVVKFKIKTQLILLAYQHEKEEIRLILMAIGSHENFYRDLER